MSELESYTRFSPGSGTGSLSAVRDGGPLTEHAELAFAVPGNDPGGVLRDPDGHRVALLPGA